MDFSELFELRDLAALPDLSPGEDVFFQLPESSLVGYFRRSTSQRLVVFYNGAVDRSRAANGLVFQRRTWADDVEASVLILPDATLFGRDGLAIGWGLGDPDDWFIRRASSFSRALSAELGVADHDRVYFGSSAGGTQALFSSVLDKGSRALVNNPQLNWVNYDVPSAVNRAVSAVFGTLSPEEVLDAFPERVSFLSLVELEHHFPPVRYYLNARSLPDWNDQFLPLMRAVPVLREMLVPALDVRVYHDADSGHSPLARGQALSELNRFLRSDAHMVGTSQF